MAYGFAVEVWGERALFTRPELSVERMSYDCITPSAARGLIESIYWHPGICYKIDRIHILNPITFTNMRRNEVKSKASISSMRTAITGKKPLPHINTKKDIVQRASLILTDVHYVIEAHFDLTDEAASQDNPGKYKDIIRRRLEKGQCYSAPYFGTREFPAFFKAYEGSLPPRGFYASDGRRDLGLMLYDMDYTNPSNITPMFFRAVMNDGVINVADSEVFR